MVRGRCLIQQSVIEGSTFKVSRPSTDTANDEPVIIQPALQTDDSDLAHLHKTTVKLTLSYRQMVFRIVRQRTVLSRSITSASEKAKEGDLSKYSPRGSVELDNRILGPIEPGRKRARRCQRDIDVQILSEVSVTFCDVLEGCMEEKYAQYAM